MIANSYNSYKCWNLFVYYQPSTRRGIRGFCDRGESPGGGVEESQCGKSCGGDNTLICGVVAMVATILSVWTELVPTSTTSDILEHLLADQISSTIGVESSCSLIRLRMEVED